MRYTEYDKALRQLSSKKFLIKASSPGVTRRKESMLRAIDFPPARPQ